MTLHDTSELLDYRVVKTDAGRCVDDIVQWIMHGDSCRWSAGLNPHSYVVAMGNSAFSAALRNADWVLPDGVGIVLASRLLGGGIRERVTGCDIFYRVHQHLNCVNGHSVFFLGSTKKTLDLIRARMAIDFPRVHIAGCYSPPFKDFFSAEDNDRMISAVNEAAPDVLWVGMTAPKQELWVHQNVHRLNVKFAGAIGAVFDFYTGQVKRSHPFFQRHGMEWVVRFLREPRRMWHRPFISVPIFLWHLTQAKLRH